MSNRPEEISSILKEQIRNYKSRIEMNETGTVITVGDGIARVYGLRSCMPMSSSALRTAALAWPRTWKRIPSPSPC